MKLNIKLFILFYLMPFVAKATNVDSIIENRLEFRNSIILFGADYFTFPGVNKIPSVFFPGDQLVGIYYKKKITRKLGIKLGYCQWNTFPWFRQNLKDHAFSTANLPFDFTKGAILFSYQYKMGDVFIEYLIYNKKNGE